MSGRAARRIRKGKAVDIAAPTWETLFIKTLSSPHRASGLAT